MLSLFALVAVATKSSLLLNLNALIPKQTEEPTNALTRSIVAKALNSRTTVRRAAPLLAAKLLGLRAEESILLVSLDAQQRGQ